MKYRQLSYGINSYKRQNTVARLANCVSVSSVNFSN